MFMCLGVLRDFDDSVSTYCGHLFSDSLRHTLSTPAIYANHVLFCYWGGTMRGEDEGIDSKKELR